MSSPSVLANKEEELGQQLRENYVIDDDDLTETADGSKKPILN